MGSNIDIGIRRTLEKNASPWVATLNLCNSAIGVGVLSFPYGFRQAGIAGGLFLIGVIWLIEVFVLCFLVRVAEKHSPRSYQQLVHSVLGSNFAVFTSVIMFTCLVGFMISFMIITGNVFVPVFSHVFGEKSVFAKRSVVILLFTILVILPLSMKTRLRSIKYSSFLSVMTLLYLVVVVVTIGAKFLIKNGLPSDIIAWNVGRNAFVTIYIAMMAFQCHIQVIPIFAELSEQPDPFFGGKEGHLEERLLDEEVILQISRRHRTKKIRRMDEVIFLSMSICLVSFCLVGLAGFVMFPEVELDFLNSFGYNSPLVNVARIGTGLAAIVCYPMQHFAARSIVDDAVKALVNNPTLFSSTRHTTITIVLVGLTTVIALTISDLGTVFTMFSLTGAVVVIFLVPGLLLIKGRHLNAISYDERNWGSEEILNTRSTSRAIIQVSAGYLLSVLGVLIFVVVLYVHLKGML